MAERNTDSLKDKSKNRRMVAVLVLTIIFASCFGVRTDVAAAENEFPANLVFSVDGGEPAAVKALNAYYEYNYYVSARDLAALLSGTGRQFSVKIGQNSVAIERGGEYVKRGDENTPFLAKDINRIFTAKAKLNQITIDGKEVRYYNFILQLDGVYECFLRLSDAAMIFDLTVLQTDGLWNIITDLPYEPDLLQMEEYGYFSGINSALVGDVTTGEIFYGYHIDTPYAIASITKLMNYVVLLDAIMAGEISEDDYVIISPNASRMSISDDGMFPMEVGLSVPLEELAKAMLIPSCNEAALAIAEHVCGSETIFVERMNGKARDLGLTTAVFYSSNGLPVYSNTLFAAKLSNQMSARDLFALINYILETYPQITRLTTIREEVLPTLGVKVTNNNPLLYNMSDIMGMKSGTTTRAGTCLSTMREVADPDGMVHQIVAIELGTETNVDRGSYSEVLMRYGSLMVQRGEHGTVSRRGLTPYPAPELSEKSAPFTVFVIDTAKRHGLLAE